MIGIDVDIARVNETIRLINRLVHTTFAAAVSVTHSSA
jgi:hypothetical protein